MDIDHDETQAAEHDEQEASTVCPFDFRAAVERELMTNPIWAHLTKNRQASLF